MFDRVNRVFTHGGKILGSKVQCMFCFETSTTEGRGGEKGGQLVLMGVPRRLQERSFFTARSEKFIDSTQFCIINGLFLDKC